MTAEQPEIILHPSDPDLAASRWVVVGASVQGTGHLKFSLPCQDAYAYKALNGSVLVAAVADGLGSAAYAQAGAQLAVARRGRVCGAGSRPYGPWRRSCLDRIDPQLFSPRHAPGSRKKRKQSQAALRDYSTTLILAVLARRLAGYGSYWGWCGGGFMGRRQPGFGFPAQER